MKTKVIMVRHGETELNVQCRFLGNIDEPLNEKGKMQAGFSKDALINEPIDAVYSSPMKRAYETAEIICKKRSVPIVRHKGLREISCGLWEGLNGQEVERQWPGQIELWCTKPSEVIIEGGDTFQEVWNRVYETFWEIVRKERGKTILITSHMICLQLLMLRFYGKGINDIWNAKSLANAALNIIEVDEKNQVQIIAWGDDSFMPEKYRQKEVPVAGKHCEK